MIKAVYGTTVTMMFIYITSLLLFSYAASSSVKYDGHQVLKIFPTSEDKAKFVVDLVEKLGLDIWHKHHNDNSLDVQVFPHLLETVKHELSTYNISFSTWIHDVQSLIDNQFSGHVNKRATPQSRTFTKYHTFEEIEALLTQWQSDPGTGPSGDSILSETRSIGRTVEGRDIHLVKIYKPSANPKKAIFVDGAIHAREWISPAFLLYLYQQLKFNPSQAANVEDLVDTYDWYLVPVLNPDGYSFSHASDRLWRKNRRINSGNTCHGVDLNRNFGYMWNPAVGGSTSACSQIYSGTGAFSEEESKALKNFFDTSNDDFLSYLTVHSYGQMWLYPWGYTSALPADWVDLDNAAGDAITALRAVHNTRYVKGSSTNVLYSAAGGSDDWAKGGANVKYSYTLELRDTGRNGFLLPTNEIIPTCEETMAAFIAIANHLKTAPQ